MRDARPNCLFCHWTKVTPGTNCTKCNTYMPKPSAPIKYPVKGVFDNDIFPEKRRKEFKNTVRLTAAVRG